MGEDGPGLTGREPPAESHLTPGLFKPMLRAHRVTRVAPDLIEAGTGRAKGMRSVGPAAVSLKMDRLGAQPQNRWVAHGLHVTRMTSRNMSERVKTS
jgi:hypothetical protein